nr:hypothetical protein [Halostella litorea]
MILAIDEGLVGTENIDPGPEGDISTARLLSEGFKSITENGVLGDPAKATTDAGEVKSRTSWRRTSSISNPNARQSG